MLLSEGTNALPVLTLTLAFPELVSTTLAILLSLSFLSESNLEQFVSLMCEPVTFEVFQHSLIQHRHSPAQFDDFIVILQKLTSRDPATLKTLMSTRVIETLNQHINTSMSLRESLSKVQMES